VLYTDGLVERPGQSLDEGLERLERSVDVSAREPQRICDALMGALLPTGAGMDDAALIVMTIPPLSDPFTAVLPADPDSVTIVRRVLTRWLYEAGATEEEAGEIVLACSEACGNAIEHAYGPDAGEFEVEAASIPGGVTVVVRDTGRWREPRGDNRGRGMVLMRGLVDDVEVRRGSVGTAVHLTRRLFEQAA
jgi:anti-sigma regulatory factor (Ser/Thr protein kinase)